MVSEKAAAPGRAHPALRGRAAECARLDALLARAHDAESGALVMLGEPGVGKSALLDYAAQAAVGMRVVRAIGVESETELAFAGLYQLTSPLLGALGELPEPQRAALETAFGRRSGPPPAPFLLALATLTLLADESDRLPIVCLIDDAQWLDRASLQVLGFVARRLHAERVAMVFATRARMGEIAAIDVLEITGLDDADARELLRSTMHVRLDERVRERVIAEARGNPLALIELPRALGATQLAGGFGLVGAGGIAERVEAAFLNRVCTLAPEVRLFLLVAAAEVDGDAAVISRAAHRLGVAVAAAAESAEEEGLIVFDDHATFRHPLVRSGIYRASPAEQRRAVHAALADAIDGAAEPERHAWHRAAATAGRDENTAAELERASARVRGRGGPAAAAGFLERAAALTPDAAVRGRRTLAAATASVDAGDFDEARGLLAKLRGAPLDAADRARAGLLAGQISLASGPEPGAAGQLLAAARALAPHDVDAAREGLLIAWGAAAVSGRLGIDGVLRGLCETALDLTAHAHPVLRDVLLEALARLTLQGPEVAEPLLREVCRRFPDEDLETGDLLRWGWLATAASNALWDARATREISARLVDAARTSGALGNLPMYLTALATALCTLGELDEAAALLAETDAVVEVTGTTFAPYAALRVAALAGAGQRTKTLAAAALTDGGPAMATSMAHWALAVLGNGGGDYKAAAEAAAAAARRSDEPWVSVWVLPELIEAGLRCGDVAAAQDAEARLRARAGAASGNVARGMVARSSALTAEGPAAEAAYREAIHLLTLAGVRTESARARLLYGEWLRRQGRRLDARAQLQDARAEFLGIGMAAFAERTRRELLAAGVPVRRREPGRRENAATALTEQEHQIALLVREGMSNPEVGARLFLSPRTVEWHLRKVFDKLGIASRRQLRDTLSLADDEGSR